MPSSPILFPPATKGHHSVARLANYWYAVCLSTRLRDRPLGITLLGTPLVLFRTQGGAVKALLDRCAHRNAPLSLGTVKDGQLECAYHGWQFCGNGQCTKVPGLIGERHTAWRVPSYAAEESDGLVWVYAESDAQPQIAPFGLEIPTGQGYTTVIREVEAEATLHATVENALDVPHTAFLHRGLFRGGKQNEITAIVSRYADRVEIEYKGEPRPPGVVARLLSPSGGVVQHWDRFYLPSVAQVEYRLGEENHFLVTSMCTPVSDFVTKLFAVLSFRTRLSGRWLKYVLEPFAMRIFRQDAMILKQQTRTIARFGGEQFVSTQIDLMGPHVWRLLKQAEAGTLAGDDEPTVRTVRFLA